jgi:signal transduction histidine kinase
VLILINGLALSVSAGLVFVMLILPRRGAANRWFSLFLVALGLWAYFAMARIIAEMSPFDETENFYVLFMALAAAPVALYGFVVSLVKPRDGLAPAFLGWGLVYAGAMIVLLWMDRVVKYRETGADRVDFTLRPVGIVVAVHIGLFLVLSFFYLQITPNKQWKVLRVPVALMVVGYAKNLIVALRLPPLSIGLLTGASLLVSYYLLRWQLFNPLREVHEELGVANNDLRQALADLSKERDRAGKLRDELAEASRYKSQFLSDMGHQLRTPLSSIVGYSDLLLDGTYGTLNETQRDRAEKISRNGITLLSLINDVIDLSKIEGGRMVLNLAPVRVGLLAGSLLDESAPQASARALRVERQVDQPLRLVRVDEERIRQVICNLIENAFKFTSQGHIRLEVKNVVVEGGQSPALKLPVIGWLEDRAWVLISVEDTGIGIPAEDQAAIFDEFKLASSEQGAQYEGSGLGLTIAKKLVELHGGRIWVRSQVGEGSTFFVALPALDEFEA